MKISPKGTIPRNAEFTLTNIQRLVLHCHTDKLNPNILFNSRSYIRFLKKLKFFGKICIKFSKTALELGRTKTSLLIVVTSLERLYVKLAASSEKTFISLITQFSKFFSDFGKRARDGTICNEFSKN